MLRLARLLAERPLAARLREDAVFVAEGGGVYYV